MLLNTITAL